MVVAKGDIAKLIKFVVSEQFTTWHMHNPGRLTFLSNCICKTISMYTGISRL